MAADADELVSSAQDALTSGDYDAALQAVNASIALRPTAPAHHLLGVLCFMDDRFVEAATAWQDAFRRARSMKQHTLAARAAMQLAGLHTGYNGLDATGRGWLERARMELEKVGPCVEWGYLELAVMACDRPDIEDLVTSAQRALDIAVEFGDANLEAQAMADRGLALVSRGAAREGFALLDATLAAISADEVDTSVAMICFCSMLSAADRAGDVRRAEEWVRVITPLVQHLNGKPHVLQTHCRVAYGSVLCTAGRWNEAESLLLDALGPSDHPDLCHRALTVAHLAGLRIDQGRIEEAADLLVPFEDQITSCAPLARVHLRRGEPGLAAAVLRRGLAEMVGDAVRGGQLLALLVDAALQGGDIDAAKAAADQLSTLAADADLDVLRADAAVADGRVLAALGDVPGAVECFGIAKPLLSSGRPLHLGLLRLELAALLASAGDTPGAITEARAALACFDRLGAATARDRAAAVLRGLGDTGRPRPQNAGELAASLTRREREVLDLIRRGLTNAQIAERLYISAKTAEHHVGRVLAKLGVRSRAEAAALAVRLAATPD